MWRLAVSGWTPPRPDLPTPNGGVPRPDLLPPSTTGDGRETAPVTWRAIEAIPVFVMAIVFAGVAGAAVYLVFQGCSARFTVSTLFGELAFGVAVIVWVRYVSHARLAALGLPRRPLIDVAAGFGTGLALLFAGGIVLLVVRAIATQILGHAPPEADQVQACVQGSALAYLGPVVILIAPVGEELFFRGFLYKSLRRGFSVWPAALISSAVFAAAHFAGVGFLILIPALFVVGIGLALIYEKRQSLLASVSAHATFNLIGFLMIALSRR